MGWSEQHANDGSTMYTYDADDDAATFYREKPKNGELKSANTEGRPEEKPEDARDSTWGYLERAPEPRSYGMGAEYETAPTTNVQTRNVKFKTFLETAYQKEETCCTSELHQCEDAVDEPMCVTPEQYMNYLRSGTTLVLTTQVGSSGLLTTRGNPSSHSLSSQTKTCTSTVPRRRIRRCPVASGPTNFPRSISATLRHQVRPISPQRKIRSLGAS